MITTAPPVTPNPGRRRHRATFLLIAGLAGTVLAACAPQVAERPGPGVGRDQTAQVPPAATRSKRKVGDPYQINGVWYFPQADPNYDEFGLASWYGAEFHGRPTANGEYFDMRGISAAHKTLPLPSWVYVTNLDNGRRMPVRVNDRGPFVNGRIIDLSREAADALGMRTQGVARVRVQVVAEDEFAGLEANRAAGATQVASLAPSPDAASAPTQPPVPRNRSVASAPLPSVIGAANAAPPPAPVPASAPAPVARSPLYVQAGAFAFKENAERLRTALADHGSVTVEPIQSGGRTLYRVRIGPLYGVEAADRTLDQVIAAGHTSARIVVECQRNVC